MIALFNLIDTVLGIFTFILFLSVISSWLIHFNIINPYQPFVRTVMNVIHAITEPVLRPIRKILPHMGGVDLSPLIALLLVFFLRDFVRYDLRLMFS